MRKSRKSKPFDLFGFIVKYEEGRATEEQIIKGFQYLIDSGLAWRLQGAYGRMAVRLIEAGKCRPAVRRPGDPWCEDEKQAAWATLKAKPAVVTVKERDEQGPYQVTVPNIEVPIG